MRPPGTVRILVARSGFKFFPSGSERRCRQERGIGGGMSRGGGGEEGRGRWRKKEDVRGLAEVWRRRDAGGGGHRKFGIEGDEIREKKKSGLKDEVQC